MTDIQFIDGLIAKAPNPKAPEYVKASLSIKREDLIAWLQSRHDEWINADVKVAKSGKWYAAVNGWKPSRDNQSQSKQRPAQVSSGNDFQDDEIPF